MTPIPLASAHKSHFLQTIFILLCSLWDSSLIINMEEKRLPATEDRVINLWPVSFLSDLLNIFLLIQNLGKKKKFTLKNMTFQKLREIYRYRYGGKIQQYN